MKSRGMEYWHGEDVGKRDFEKMGDVIAFSMMKKMKQKGKIYDLGYLRYFQKENPFMLGKHWFQLQEGSLS